MSQPQGRKGRGEELTSFPRFSKCASWMQGQLKQQVSQLPSLTNWQVQMLTYWTGMVLGTLLINLIPSSQELSTEAVVSPVLPQVPPADVAATLNLKPAVAKSVLVDLSKAEVYVFDHNNRIIAHYPAAIGAASSPTPVGVFRIKDKRSNPTWKNPRTGEVVPPSPTSPIGDRWIEFTSTHEGLIGFHGTDQEGTVGQAVSWGCLRMRRQDLHQLYSFVRIGTPVIVRN